MVTLSPQLQQFAQWLAGHFNNLEQAIDQPVWFANIHVYQCPLSLSVFGDLAFYVEQVYDINLNAPYRQRVVRLLETDGIMQIKTYALKAPESYMGAGRDLAKLKAITSDQVEEMPGCLSSIEWTGSHFKGQSLDQSCIVVRKNQTTYHYNEFELTENHFKSLDQGKDPDTHQVVWGSLSGPFEFNKIEDFSAYLPTF